MKAPSADNSQLKAINHRTGPAIVYAGPGTGKTFVITHHILFLLEFLKIPPENILVLTFTNEAARSMRERFLALSDSVHKDKVVFGTFHSVFYRVLKTYSKLCPAVAEDSLRYRILTDISDSHFKRDDLFNLISGYKSGADAPSFFNNPELKSLFFQKLDLYNEIMNQNGVIDFDDILIKVHELLSNNPGLSEMLSKRFGYILIDEFQDTNYLQYSILKQFVPKNGNIFVVGDENQSIYGFRGSKPGIFGDFTNDFENAAVYRLDTDYRNHERIVAGACNMLEIENRVKTPNKKAGCGLYVKYLDSKEHEYEEFLHDLRREKDEGSKIAVLSRTNKDLEALRRMYVGSVSGDSKEVCRIGSDKGRDLYTALLSLTEYLDTHKRTELLKWLSFSDNMLPRSIFLKEKITPEEIAAVKNPAYGDRLTELASDLRRMEKLSPSAFILYVRRKLSEKGFESKDIETLLSETEGKIKNLKGRNELKEYLFKRLRDTADNKRNIKADTDENPAFLTFHASKGLEFDAVFIVDLIDGKVPRRNDISESEIEEEKRLFYVAMTRAGDRLYLYSIKRERDKSAVPSRFLKNLKTDLI